MIELKNDNKNYKSRESIDEIKGYLEKTGIYESFLDEECLNDYK